MAIKDILQIGHPLLATRASEINTNSISSEQVQNWATDMVDTMRDANGAGISANQIGIPHRMFVIEITDNPRYPYMPKIPLTVVINPEITFLSDATFTSNEGCLSVPNMRANVEWHLEISVSYFDEKGEKHNREIKGYSACVWQHEYDHLDGILFPQRVTDNTSFSSWDSFQEYHQTEYAKKVESLVSQWHS